MTASSAPVLRWIKNALERQAVGSRQADGAERRRAGDCNKWARSLPRLSVCSSEVAVGALSEAGSRWA